MQNYLEKLEHYYELALKICQRKPHLDREHIVQSLMLLELSPLERLNKGLLRGKAIKNAIRVRTKTS